MVCKKCNAEIEENATVCKECGTPVTEDIEILDVIEEEKETKKFPEEEGTYALDFEEENSTRKNRSTGIFTGLVIGLMIGVIAVIAVFFLMKKQMENKEEEGGSVTVETQRITFGGYTFSAPKKVEYLITADTLYLGNEEGTWTAQIGKKTFDYNVLSKNLNQMKLNATALGFTTKTVKESKLGNDPYITMELSANNGNYLAAYTKASSSEVFFVLLYNTTNSFDHDSLKTVASVLKTAKVSSNHMKLSSVNASMVGAIAG